jgi:membrane associated rhomboid family serine protease
VQARHDVKHALPSAEHEIVLELGSVLEQVVTTLRYAERLLRAAPRPDKTHGRFRRIRPGPPELSDDSSRDEGVVERQRSLNTRADDHRSVPSLARGVEEGGEVEKRGDEHTVAPRSRHHDRAGPVRRREDERLVQPFQVFARRVPKIEARDHDVVALAAEDALSELGLHGPRLLDLGRAEHPRVAGGEGLADRRGRADHVDDDSGRGLAGIGRSERDVDAHAGTLAAVAEALRCYRHPDRETYVSCTECGRGICPDCMVFGPVGIRCLDHAKSAAAAPTHRAKQTFRQARYRSTSVDVPATFALIGMNVLVYLITVVQGAGVNAPGGEIFERGALVGIFVADGDWYRLVSAMFLHASILHLAFNMFALWWLGSIVERALGTSRFLLVYFVSGLAGSAGALLLSPPTAVTVGASGAIFGIMGALLILEWQETGSLAGPAMTLIVLNLALSLTIPNISIGGHLGGLIGGIAATFVLTSTRHARTALLGPALVALIGIASVAVAYVRVETFV